MFRGMGVRADRDDLTAKLTVAPDHLAAWIRLSKTIMIATSIKFKSHMPADQLLQDLIQDILKTSI